MSRSPLLSLALWALAGPSVSACAGDKAAPDSGAPVDAGDGADGTTAPVDQDGDGSPEGEDCDDTDDSVHPGAEESCNGADDDCDGEVDEEPVDGEAVWADADGDGWGDPEREAVACAPASGEVTQGGDCDDADPAVHPEAEEACDGLDQDCDGDIDEGLPAPEGWVDADGDGYGDPDTPAADCRDADRAVSDDTDCDDTDPSVHPGAVELQDGVDNDCDTALDEAVAVVVVGYQCQVHAADSWADEVAAIHRYLADLSLLADEIDEDPSSSEDDAFVGAYDLALFSKCGWAWQTYNQDMLDALLLARARGTHTFLFDDDISYYQYNVTGSEGLVFLEDAPINGTRGQTAEIDATATHPAYLGPHGTPTDFTYAWDIDQTTALGAGEQVLGTHTGGYPWWLVWEDATTGTRSTTLAVNLYSANEGSIGADARAQVEVIFKNVVTWMLDL